MANEEQLSILKQGVEVWNRWRKDNAGLVIYLRNADLVGAELSGADLRKADLVGANFSGSNLSGANLRGAELTHADLSAANLSNADMMDANLPRANFSEANLSGAILRQTKLFGAKFSRANLRGAILHTANLAVTDLRDADLSESDLSQADLQATKLAGCNLSGTAVRNTSFGDLDLRQIVGLELMVHSGPSHIPTSTFTRSKGQIPEVFLRGCGLNDWEIEMVRLYNPDVSNEERSKILYRIFDLQASQALQISPLFISYGHSDSAFVDKVGDHLTKKGVRYWRDIHEMKAGRIEKQIDRAISQNPTFLLVLSEHSLKSDWVEHEVRIARELEKGMGRDVLCPVALDDSWKSSRWPKRIMEQIMEYNILDFSEWEDDVKFDSLFRKLIDGLELFYKG